MFQRVFRLAAIAVMACSAQRAAAAEPLPFRYAQTGSTWRSVFSLPMRVAVKQGFFARHGLAFAMVPLEGGAETSLVALEEGRADAAHVAASFLVTAAMRGADTVAVTAEFNNPIYSLVAKPWVKDIRELKGRRIGMADMNGAVSLATLALFEKHGLKRADLDIRVIEGTPDRFTCLTIGDCDAVPLGQPQDFFARRQGFRLLGATNEAVPDFLYTVTAARRPWAQANKEAMTRYARAMADTFPYIRDPANRADVAALMMEAWRSSEESALSTLDLFFNPEKNVMPMRGEIDMKGLAQVIRFMKEGGVIKGEGPEPASLVDLRYLEAAAAR